MSDATAELERAAADIPLNRDARDVLEKATALASQRGAPQAGPVDVLEAILADRGSSAYGAIKTLSADPQAVNAEATREDGGAGLPLRQLLVNANREAQVLGHYQVDSIHLLLALLYSDSRATSAALQKA
ncbi:MAG TPA: Clp protease N-terminal domain-containing protein, partial [Myxococcales bacterium]